MNIEWYPGHMTRAFRRIKDDLKLIDLVVEIVDARLPVSSRNPEIDSLCANKKRILILNKADLSDPNLNDKWECFYKEKGHLTILNDSRKNSNKKIIEKYINEALAEKKERDKKRGILNRPLRVLVAGIPNVGKSTFINSIAKKSVAKTGDKPGITKGNQWISIGKGIELLDSPGLLWPKFEDEKVGMRLALVGSINDNIIDLEELAVYGIDFLKTGYKGILNAKYSVNEDASSYDILSEIAKNLNLIKAQNELDTARAARLFLNDLRAGKIGKISLESPEEDH